MGGTGAIIGGLGSEGILIGRIEPGESITGGLGPGRMGLTLVEEPVLGGIGFGGAGLGFGGRICKEFIILLISFVKIKILPNSRLRVVQKRFPHLVYLRSFDFQL